MPHQRTAAPRPCLKLPPRPSITVDPPKQYQPPKRKVPEFNESETCHYMEQGASFSPPPFLIQYLTHSAVYKCCASPYTTTVPPQVRHISSCPYSHQPLPSNIQPKLICQSLRRTPVSMVILAMCDPCILKDGGLHPRADLHMDRQVGLDGEWVLAFKREKSNKKEADMEEEGRKNLDKSRYQVREERWIRIEGKKAWREWSCRKREKGDEKSTSDSDIVAWIDGEEWTVLH
ncbi:hypothetical protein EG329_002190 [Mollisiaceae sp. DMI_Dod_QoI]|nr:hypothetical protein EG329_002190 [Helotiales sp. DMI_Dod_QoI]